ncbi:MAG: ABC transporter ATP-binding protein [Spirochaetaceae bacterium]|jgi:ABC-2 type transport system ATP-binding protein|nr:ABC transporter ATP-binding protein [Spirochaetaceae bacterium]
MIQIKSIWKYYDNIPVLKDISFTINKGEIVGLLGPNGAGKTTLLKIISAFHMPDKGAVHINKLSVFEDSCKVKTLCGYLLENTPLYENMTVNEYLHFILSARGLKKSEIITEKDILIKLFSLGSYGKTIISKLSSGYRQRCAIAGSLAGNVSVLILDEPAKGLDPIQIVELRDIIKSYASDVTIIISSHILSEIEILCNRILILNEGELKYDTKERMLEQDNSVIFKVIVSGDKKNIENLFNSEKLTLLSIKESRQKTFELKIKISSDLYKKEQGAPIFDELVGNSIRLHKMELEIDSLEKTFMKVKGGRNE